MRMERVYSFRPVPEALERGNAAVTLALDLLEHMLQHILQRTHVFFGTSAGHILRLKVGHIQFHFLGGAAQGESYIIIDLSGGAQSQLLRNAAEQFRGTFLVTLEDTLVEPFMLQSGVNMAAQMIALENYGTRFRRDGEPSLADSCGQ